MDKYPNIEKWLKHMDSMDEVKEAYRKIQEAPKP